MKKDPTDLKESGERCGGGVMATIQKAHELAKEGVRTQVLMVREHDVDSGGSRFPRTVVGLRRLSRCRGENEREF